MHTDTAGLHHKAPDLTHEASRLLLEVALSSPLMERDAICTAIVALERAFGRPLWSDGAAADWLDHAAWRLEHGPLWAFGGIQRQLNGECDSGDWAPEGAQRAFRAFHLGSHDVAPDITPARLRQVAMACREGNQWLSDELLHGDLEKYIAEARGL